MSVCVCVCVCVHAEIVQPPQYPQQKSFVFSLRDLYFITDIV